MMGDKQLIVAIEGTATLGFYWQSILTDYLEKIIRYFHGNELTGQKLSGTSPDLALVVFNTHGPYSDFTVRRSGWTKDLDVFLECLSSLSFSGGGFCDAAIAEGLSEVLSMMPPAPATNDSHQGLEVQRHCILVAASNPYPLPTPVYRPSLPIMEQNDSSEAQKESCLADAETVAKLFGQCSISLSVISPRQLPKLQAVYNAGKRNPRATDPVVDHAKNPHFLLLLSENFMEARAALTRPLISNLAPNQSTIKLDGVSTAPITPPPSTANHQAPGLLMNRQPTTVGNVPTATVKVEPASMVSGTPFSHMPSIANVASQGVPTLQNSSSSPISKEMNANNESVQDLKPFVNPTSQPLRPAVPAPANVSILNNLSQHRLPTMGGTPMAMHMSNMISSGMASSAMTGSGPLLATTQVAQNTTLGSFNSATSNMSGSSNIGVSPALANLQGNISSGQSMPTVGQGNLTSNTQINQAGMSMNQQQNMMNSLVPNNMSSGPGSMIPTPGISQQAGAPSVGMNTNPAMNLPMAQHTSNAQQSKYVRIWEGSLSGTRQGQPVFICNLEGYRNQSASDSLASDWPSTMQIVRLIAQEHMNNKQYVGKADFLVFRTLNQHGFLGQLQEKKLCAVIQLPSQTLLLSVSDKAGRLIGMLFPGDMVVFKPQVPNQQQQQPQQQQQQQQQLQPQPQPQQLQPQQLQQLQPQQLQQQQQQLLQQLQPQQQSHSHMQQHQLQQQQQQQQQQLQQQSQHQHMQQPQSQQQQQQQMMGTGMGQTFVQGNPRSQLMTQGKVQQPGPGNMSGGGFMS